MKTVGGMAGVGVLSCLAVIAWFGARTRVEVVLGAVAPLAVAGGTWMLIERTHRRDPERMTGLLLASFAGKMVFFGAYVAVILKGLALQPVPFVVSFTSCFIELHVMEAFALRRLLATGPRATR